MFSFFLFKTLSLSTMMFRRFPLRFSFLTLLVGVVFGFCLISLVNQSFQLVHQQDNTVVFDNSKYIQRLNENQTKSYENQVILDEKGKDLFDKVRVLCWILTSPENHETKALAVKETWGKRCNVLLFMSSGNDSNLPSVQLAVREGRNGLWGKTREAFRYAWDRYQDEVDWFLKADDDTYVIVENLRYFLMPFNTSKPLWFGHKFKSIVKSGYFSGGAGYVLSKEATRRFVKEGYFNALICRHDHEGAEDAEMGKCMENLKVLTMDTRDSRGRGRFHPFIPNNVYFPGNITQDYWYWKSIYYPPTKGAECCSDSTISFHYVDVKMMRLLDFFLYQIRPFGIVDQRPSTPEPPPDLDLTASPWFAPNVTTTISPDTIRTRSSEEIQQSQIMHQHLLEYLLEQLKPYGIVDPNETHQGSSNMASNSASGDISNPNRTTEVLVNPQQIEFLRGYVMDQLEPFGIIDPNQEIMASPTLAPTPSTVMPINPIDVIDTNSQLGYDSIVDSQQMQQYLRDFMRNQLQHSEMVSPNEKIIASPIVTTPSSSPIIKDDLITINNSPDMETNALLIKMLRSLGTAQSGFNPITAQ